MKKMRQINKPKEKKSSASNTDQKRKATKKQQGTETGKNKPKDRKVVQLRVMERKEDRQLGNIESRKESRKDQRKKDNKKNVKKRVKERKERRGRERGGSRKERKKKRKEKRKKERQRRSNKIENSLLGKAIPKGRIKEFKKKFANGKKRTTGFASFKFLTKLDFPFSGTGTLRKDFRQLVKKRVINKLPDYCEEVKIEKSEKVKKDCVKRAKRIKERIIARLGKKKNLVGTSKHKKNSSIKKKKKMKINTSNKKKQVKKKI